MVTVSPVDPELARVGSAAGSTLAKGLKPEDVGRWKNSSTLAQCKVKRT